LDDVAIHFKMLACVFFQVSKKTNKNPKETQAKKISPQREQHHFSSNEHTPSGPLSDVFILF
jgi:hypothetical protein